MSKKIHAVTAMAAAMLAGSAFAQGTTLALDAKVDANANITMPAIDTNADGKVSKTEAASNAKLAQKFDSYDANKDGNLDKGEFARFEAEGKAKAKTGKTEETPSKDGASGTPPAPKD